MNKELFANHLGFYTWEQLIRESELVSHESNRTWYITETPTWYKWILWNTDCDVYFKNATKEQALGTLKYVYHQNGVHSFVWYDSSNFDNIQPNIHATHDDYLTWFELH